MQYYAITTENSLSHHGILGQKWGKKNGPPYPLDESDHSASERKAGWKKSLDKEKKSKSGEFISKHKKEILIGSAAVLAGAAYYATHKRQVDKLIRGNSKQLYSDISSIMSKSQDNLTNPRMVDLKLRGRDFMNNKIYTIPKTIKKGVSEGLKEGTGKASKAVGVGVSMLAAKEVLDIIAGPKNSEKIFKANNKKKIDSFWKVYNENLNNNKQRDDDE